MKIIDNAVLHTTYTHESCYILITDHDSSYVM